jgi:site-specific DNA-cytosine methylase
MRPPVIRLFADEAVVDLFAGGGGASEGMAMILGRSPDVAINHNREALAMHAANHPTTKHFKEDVFAVDPIKALGGKKCGLMWLSPDCFPAGTLILTTDGYLPIEDIEVGDFVLTHQGNYRRVTETMVTNRPLVTVRGQGHPGLSVSAEHPFYARSVRNVWNQERRAYDRTLGEPEWVKAADLRTVGAPITAAGGDLSFWATPCEFPELPIPVVQGRGMQIDEQLMWLAGRYVGDGWTRLTDERAELVITCGMSERDELRLKLNLWDRKGARATYNELAWHERATGTAYQFTTSHQGLVEWLRAYFGHGALNKALPGWAFGMERSMRQALLDGYTSADGCVSLVGSSEVQQASTVSKALAFSLRALAESLGHSVNVNGPYEGRGDIEGRQVNASPFWVVKWREELQRPQNVRDGLHNWTRVRSVESEDRTATVFNLSVEGDESYIAEGVVVHNCTYFSKAAGGAPFRDRHKARKVRGLIGVALKWASNPRTRPRVMCIENVEEIEHWCPIGDDGRPHPEKRGQSFRRWVARIRNLGGDIQWRQLRGCDYGSPTTRKRLFIVVRFDGQPIVWPEATHGPKRHHAHRSAASCIDFSLPVPSIFLSALEAKAWGKANGVRAPRRPLAKASLRRIARGVDRFVLQSSDPFIVPVTHQGDERVHSVRDPLRNITTAHRGEFALIAPSLINTRNGERPGQLPRIFDIQQPLRTVTASGSQGALVAAFLAKHNAGNEATGQRLQKPCDTVTTRDSKALVASHLLKLRGGLSDHVQTSQDVREPIPTLTAGGTHLANVQSRLVPLTDTDGRCGLSEAEFARATKVYAFLVKFYGTAKVGRPLTAPLDVVTTKGRFGLVLVTVAGVDHVLVDIGMRMLTPRELFLAQGFPADYTIDIEVDQKKLTKEAQIRLVGNSVCPQLAAAIVGANYASQSEAVA